MEYNSPYLTASLYQYETISYYRLQSIFSVSWDDYVILHDYNVQDGAAKLNN